MFRDFGMDTISLAGPLAAKLAAMREAGFRQVMLAARDLVGHPAGWQAAVREVHESGLRVTGFQVLRDFEGLSGHLHDYKVDIARSMIEMAAALGSPVLLACSSTSVHATDDRDAIARDLRKLAMMALPFRIKVAFEGLSWGRHINDCLGAFEVVSRVDCPNLGIGIDSFHSFATRTPVEALEEIDPAKIFLVQLSDFMWSEIHTVAERIETARHFRVFPGEGVHSEEVARLVRTLRRLGYEGDFSFEVFNDDYQQMPLATVAERARKSAAWLAEDVLQRAVPLPSFTEAAGAEAADAGAEASPKRGFATPARPPFFSPP
ncbi:MAG: sugar phosphate isomerase/epimerase [Betaproteobacteria bacterium]|nr:sugar phosphate isomerase/epimerase [Betaproteobacteria bacterium]MCC6249240.1 sugar phosphate isomerase/epimerase [Rubrivivax sp.]MCL4695859.1 sugar phosphate isomerase/epimerase [Burkholderiaceae bacterium]